jgi:hypothetical protein
VIRDVDVVAGYEIEREPEWSEEDIALLLALLELRAEERAAAAEIGPHGRPMSEATSPNADPANRRHGWHYETRFRIDHAQRALNLARSQMVADYPDVDVDSLEWTVVRVEDGPPIPTPAT